MKTWKSDNSSWTIESNGIVEEGAFVNISIHRTQWDGTKPIYCKIDAEFIRKGTDLLFGNIADNDHIHLMYVDRIPALPKYVREAVLRLVAEILSENGIVTDLISA